MSIKKNMHACIYFMYHIFVHAGMIHIGSMAEVLVTVRYPCISVGDATDALTQHETF